MYVFDTYSLGIRINSPEISFNEPLPLAFKPFKLKIVLEIDNNRLFFVCPYSITSANDKHFIMPIMNNKKNKQSTGASMVTNTYF